MATKLTSISDDFLKCVICYEEFTDPRILPCVHSFCVECLSKHINSVCTATMRAPSFLCPTCRELVTIPDPHKPIATWAQQFRKNFMLKNLCDAVAEKDESRVSSSCIDVMTSSLSSASEGNVCTQHAQKELELFCVDCDRLLCATCIALSHRSCRQVITLEQVAEEKRRQLSKIHNLMESYLSRNEAVKSAQTQELEKLKGQYEECKNQIVDASASLQRLIIEAENMCLRDLETLFASHEQEQKKVINDADISSKRLNDMSTAVAHVIQETDDFRVVEAYPTMQHYQHTVVSNKIQIHKLEFVRNMTVYKMVEQATSGKIGEVKSVASKMEMSFVTGSGSPTSPLTVPSASEMSMTSRTSTVLSTSSTPGSAAASAPTSETSMTSRTSAVLSTSSTPGSAAASTPASLAALTAIPVLVRSVSTKVKSDKTKPSLRDIAVVPNNVFVVTDFSNSCIKSFYNNGNNEQHSKLVLQGQPHAIAVLAGNMMVATIPKNRLLVLFSVTPNLLLQSSVYTDKQYWGISAVTSDVLAVTTCPGSTPGTLVMINLKGNVLKVVNNGSGLFSNPLYLLTLPNKDIVVTDCTLPTIVCVRQNGSVIFKCRKETSSNDGTGFKLPLGLACDTYGNVVIVDKWPVVSVLSREGEVIQHILTKKEGLVVPKSIAIDENNCIYIAEEGGKVLVFKPKC